MKIKYMLLALMPLCLASCSEEETVVSAGNQREVRVTAGVGAHSRMVLNDKGQYTESLWQSGDEISLFTSTQSNLVYSTSLEGTSASASFTATGESLQYIEGNEVYACYPTAEAIGEGNQLVKLSPNGSFDYNEGIVRSFCYAVDKISKGSLNFKFKHISAFISLNVTQEMLGGKSLSHGKIMVSTSSTTPLTIGDGDYFDFTTQTATTVNGGNSLVMTMDHVKDSLGTVYLPVLPQPAGADITITLADSEGNDIYTQTKRTPASGFLAGNVYKMDTSASFEVAYLVDGPTFNQGIKDLVSGGSPDDYLIGKIQFVTESYQVPEYHVVVSAEGSAVPVYASFNQADSLLTISTAAKRMEIEDASRMFYNFLSLRTIDFGNFAINETTTDMDLMFEGCSSLISLDLSNFDTSNVTDMGGMFSRCSSLTSLNLSSFDTSKVTYMWGMFLECSALLDLDLSGFETSKVTEMYSMFSDCSSLSSLDLSSFDTSNVNDIGGMFFNCSSLTSLSLSGFDLSNVTDMWGMFSGCSSLTNLDLSGFDVSNVTNMEGLFRGCSSLSSLDLSSFNTSNVTGMGYMFFDCSSLSSLDLSGFNTSNVTKMHGMFSNCTSLINLELSSFDTSNVTEMGYMFSGCSSLESLNLSDFDISNMTDMYAMFSGCFSLTSLDISNWVMNHTTDVGHMFSSCASTSQACRVFSTLEVKEFLLSKTGETQMNPEWFIWDVDGEVAEVAYLVNGPTFNEWIKALANANPNLSYDFKDHLIGKIEFVSESSTIPADHIVVSTEASPAPVYASFNQADSLLTISTAAKRMEIEDASSTFELLASLREIDFGNFSINEATTNMYRMFSYCSSLKSLDLSGFDTSNVTNMSFMFFYCTSLSSLDLSSFDTSSVTSMNAMFKHCSSLKSLDLSSFDTSNVTDMSSMFYSCPSLVNLDLSGFDTSNVTFMGEMFTGCTSLSSLNLSSFDTSNVIDMGNMFLSCFSLSILDLTSFDTSNVTHLDGMFNNCASTSKACRITCTKETKDFLLGKTGDTSMNPAWFIWGDAENGGSGFGDMSKEEW